MTTREALKVKKFMKILRKKVLISKKSSFLRKLSIIYYRVSMRHMRYCKNADKI